MNKRNNFKKLSIKPKWGMNIPAKVNHMTKRFIYLANQTPVCTEGAAIIYFLDKNVRFIKFTVQTLNAQLSEMFTDRKTKVCFSKK